ncbi:MAG: DNA-binding transcriptional regulator OxyR [Coxiella sp. (in: Bacteria)]|nr:MAG: DNA-binding transcriptional regulator OxyR [Coxiella sp. (in: g-proteobacteria)]
MNIRDFTYLINLAKTKHFGRAAELSFVSQPTLSVQLKKLEETLGCQLIERQGKQAILTEAGRVATQYAEQITGHIHELQQHMQAFHDPLGGDFKIGIFPTLAPYLLPRIIPSIKRHLPCLNLKLFEAVTETCIQNLKEGTWDAILIADKIDDANLKGAKLFREKFFLALPKQHKLSKNKVITARQLPEEDILLLENGHCLRDQSLEYCSRINKPVHSNFSATSLETLISMVSLGEGVTFIPELSIKTFKQYPIEIKPIQPSPYRDIFLYWRKNSGRVKCAEKFQDIITADTLF